jgi:hypothetical protein
MRRTFRIVLVLAALFAMVAASALFWGTLGYFLYWGVHVFWRPLLSIAAIILVIRAVHLDLRARLQPKSAARLPPGEYHIEFPPLSHYWPPRF